ncbi:MAG: hypothetical protein WCZ90_01035 [Melioribacteraceae bacterium]
MKIINLYISGLKEAYSQKKIVTIIFAITLFLTLIVAMAFNSVIKSNLGDRPQVYKLLGDFDFATYNDLMNNYGTLINPLTTVIMWMSVFYLFFTVFFSGGILQIASNKFERVSGKNFFGGCSKFFLRFLRLGIYVLVIRFLVVLVLVLLFMVLNSDLIASSTEPKIFYTYLIWTIVHLLFFWLVSIIADYAKVILVKEDSKKVWSALWNGLKFSMKRLHITFPLYFIISLTTFLLAALYWVVESEIAMTNAATILLVALIQQVFVWLRFFSKSWILTSEYEYYNEYASIRIQPIQTQEILLNEAL